jgi:mRNA-degrading endonuclease RelE of RelBE toxin-antitoxin system
VRSIRTKAFKKLFDKLPKHVQDQADATYELFRKDPFYPSLCFKRIHASRPVYSARIGSDYRVVGLLENNTIRWYWIGSHEDYNRL